MSIKIKPKPTAGDLLGTKDVRVEVKGMSSHYSNTKSVGRHVKTGQPVIHEGREVELPSKLDNAFIGVFLKSQMINQGVSGISRLNEHEMQLLDELFATTKFCGLDGNKWVKDVDGMTVKALLNGVTSGGTNLVPVPFDENITSYPLLHSELFPYVTTVDVPMGSSVDSAAVSSPTLTWSGTAIEGTSLTLFDTTSLVSAVDTTIFPVAVGIEVGKELMSDTPVAIGDELTRILGERYSAELDKVIAIGDGSTQPLGIFGTSSPTTVSSVSGTSGDALDVADCENLIFSLPKQYRVASSRCCFVGNDENYRRFRATPVGTSDQRRVFGMDHQIYMLLEYPYRVCNDVPNAKVAFVSMSRYKLYRRQGWTFSWEAGGKTLTLLNAVLLYGRARLGGRMVDPDAVCLIEDLPA